MQTARMTRGLVVRGMWVWIAAVSMLAQAQPQPGTRPLSIEGVVTGAEDRPEAGIWVIAESGDLPTPMRKIVVTDDAGRFVVPDLPAGRWQVWARGYGLRDTAPMEAGADDTITIPMKAAATPQEAAAIYPASWWLSLMQPPEGDPAWTSHFKLGCQLCHQVGSTMTRLGSKAAFDAGLRKSTYMHVTAEGLGREKLLNTLADWSTRIAAGEVPDAPPRPAGIERNLVITQWEWGDGFTYAHDEIATDKRDPTRYRHGPVYGVDLANDRLLWLDPVKNEAGSAKVPTAGGFSTPWCAQTWQGPQGATGASVIPMGFGSLGCPVEAGATAWAGRYVNPANPHNPMFDGQGRVWITTQIRREWSEDLPSFCRNDPVIRDNYHHRQLGYYDTRTGQFQLIDTCYGTHHLQFDDRGVLWLSGDSHVIGWFDPAKYDPARPETLAAAQGWSAIRIDSDGDGTADQPITGFNYGIIPNPRDGSVWTAQPGGNPGGDPADRGRLIRFDPATGTHETYVPPKPGAGPRGVDVDSKGVIWMALGGSGHLASFDRSRCTQHAGSGDQCPEGWRIWRSPGPLMRTDDKPSSEVGADFHYYLFVDQHDTFGLGRDVVIVNGTGSDSLLAFEPRTGKWTVIRIPFPLNAYTRGLDGRIDDPDGGWKGRGLWFTNGADPIMHAERPRSYVGRVQLRPDPLAR